MSETDSFIDEVNEEVARDRLFGYMRRYGWIAALAVVVLVGGTAYNEYRKSQNAAAAQAQGEVILAALAVEDAGERAELLAAADGVAAAFLAAAADQEAGDHTGAAAKLDAIIADADVADRLRELARLKRAMVQDDLPAADREAMLLALAAPGADYAAIAGELLALHKLGNGDQAGALAQLQMMIQDAEIQPGQQQRLIELIVAMGETPELANASEADTQ